MIRRTASVLAIALLPLPAIADAPEGWSPLLEPEQLAAFLDEYGEDIRVVQITGDYESGHMPGSGWSPYSAWRSSMPSPGALRELPYLQNVVQNLGIDTDTPVVVVHSGNNASDMGAAARVYWTLKSLGIEDLALLNGGYEAWVAQDLPTETAAPSIAPSDYTAEWSDTWRSTTQQVEDVVANGSATLLDARPSGFFEGLVWSVAAPGTIQGAENLTYAQFFDGTRMLDADRVRQIASDAGYTGATTTVSFCNTGHWAAINWFALSELAGYDDVRLYAESMAEYTAEDRPMEHAPNRLQYAYRATVNWVSELF